MVHKILHRRRILRSILHYYMWISVVSEAASHFLTEPEALKLLIPKKNFIILSKDYYNTPSVKVVIT
jgi:hypothetical protein